MKIWNKMPNFCGACHQQPPYCLAYYMVNWSYRL